MTGPLTFAALGDRALTITLGSEISAANHLRVRAAVERIASRGIPGVIETVPAFASVVVHYEPREIADGVTGEAPYQRLVATLRSELSALDAFVAPEGRLIEIPVRYGGGGGPDLDDVARLHDMTPDEVVRRHTAGEYTVYMVGFIAGFAYLGGLAPELATPRRAEPRTRVPAGTVGIGGDQTGVYPIDSPGGWNLIGHTVLRLFDPTRAPATLLAIGDRVRFRASSATGAR